MNKKFELGKRKIGKWDRSCFRLKFLLIWNFVIRAIFGVLEDYQASLKVRRSGLQAIGSVYALFQEECVLVDDPLELSMKHSQNQVKYCYPKVITNRKLYKENFINSGL